MKLPMQSSSFSKDFAKDLESIEETAKKNKHAQAYFAREQGLVAVLLKDEHCKSPGNKPGLLNIDLKRSWYRGKSKFHKGDRILLVSSSHAQKGTVLELDRLSGRFDWLRLRLPSRFRWRCSILDEIEISYDV